VTKRKQKATEHGKKRGRKQNLLGGFRKFVKKLPSF
jgi:hypothetical protein